MESTLSVFSWLMNNKQRESEGNQQNHIEMHKEVMFSVAILFIDRVYAYFASRYSFSLLVFFSFFFLCKVGIVANFRIYIYIFYS